MTAITGPAPRIATATAKSHSFFNKPARPAGGSANRRAPRAVTQWQQRRVEQEISRYRRMMHARGHDDAVPAQPSRRALAGYAPALPTPFDGEDKVDLTALAHLCDHQIRHGATALVVCGTTGEAPTLARAEHSEIIRVAASAARGRVPVIAGAGSNATSHAIELARGAEAAGADALLCVVPYYNKPTQEGLYAHFRAVADTVSLPIILYDVPSRTACSLADETIVRLAERAQFIGLKDATGDVTRPLRLRPVVGTDFRLLSGDDASALAFIADGGNGCISVTSNVAPGVCRNMYLACPRGQMATAQRLASLVARLTAVLIRETSPTPVKYALSLLGVMLPRVRLPLVEPADGTKDEIAAMIADACDGYAEYMIGKMCVSAQSRRAVAV
jgi:4-hydroxy-tetrahydrodipicolinate synthase